MDVNLGSYKTSAAFSVVCLSSITTASYRKDGPQTLIVHVAHAQLAD
jgi:hypothetical protein